MVKRTEVGNPMNFRGFMYQPINEQGVVYLFGLVAKDLNIVVESIQQGYPDCTALRYIGKDRWERIRIEFEFKSSNFDHEITGCDMIVCWEDDFNERRRNEIKGVGIEILELKSLINTPEVPNEQPENPDEIEEEEVYELSYLIHSDWNKTKELFESIDKRIQEINPEIWKKVSKNSITYYSPEKVFVYVHPQKQGIKIYLFTNAEKIEGVEIPYADALKWGRIYIKNEGDLDKAITIIKKSHNIINQAIKEGLNTGWFSIPEKNTETIKELKRTAEETTSAPYLSGSVLLKVEELKEN